ncbi:MAG TPA: hypothetical protein VI504_00705 [Candidatus Eisenbacteria bacterium]
MTRTHERGTRSRSAARALVAVVAAACTAPLCASAHGDVRGPLLAPTYGGGLQIGTVISSERTLYEGESAADTYVAAGVAYGLGPNTIAGFYMPYRKRAEIEQGSVVARESELVPWSLQLQQRLWRRDGLGSRLEAVTFGSVGLYPPGDEHWPTLRPAKYALAGGLTHTGLRDIASVSWSYRGTGYGAEEEPTWLGNVAALARPSARLLARGHDLFFGAELTYEGAVNGAYDRISLAPVLEIQPVRRLWLEASWGRPVWERGVPADIQGRSSLWIRAYMQR